MAEGRRERGQCDCRALLPARKYGNKVASSSRWSRGVGTVPEGRDPRRRGDVHAGYADLERSGLKGKSRSSRRRRRGRRRLGTARKDGEGQREQTRKASFHGTSVDEMVTRTPTPAENSGAVSAKRKRGTNTFAPICGTRLHVVPTSASRSQASTLDEVEFRGPGSPAEQTSPERGTVRTAEKTGPERKLRRQAEPSGRAILEKPKIRRCATGRRRSAARAGADGPLPLPRSFRRFSASAGVREDRPYVVEEGSSGTRVASPSSVASQPKAATPSTATMTASPPTVRPS